MGVPTNHRMKLLQITERNSYKSPNETSTNHRTEFLQITERNSYKSPNGHNKSQDLYIRTCWISVIFRIFAQQTKHMGIKEYKQRIADSLLKDKLEAFGAVLIEGPKWCGKTTTAEQQAKSILYMAEPSRAMQNKELARIRPQMLLNGVTPRLIDEWQEAPQLWDAARLEVDHRGEMGQFIFTGSAVPTDSSLICHTGTGRFSWLRMRPMSLYESGESTGELSLSAIVEGKEKLFGTNRLQLDDIAFLLCRGGWPQAVGMKSKAALAQAYAYVDAVVKSDISRADNVQRDELRARRLMRSYARHQGTSVSMAALRSDLANNEEQSFDESSIATYLNALRRIFVVEDVQAWNPNLRSKTAIRSTDTRYFVDPSIGAAALELGPDDLMNDLNTFGLLFETLCMRDLRVYADALEGRIYHFRDSSGLECDAVMHLRAGVYGLIEIKLGGDRLINEGAANLLKLQSKIDTSKMKAPAFMMVLTAVGDYAYQREDGVYVAPIGSLKP